MKRMTLEEIAGRIDKHLKRIASEQDKSSPHSYFHPVAYRAGAYVAITYRSFQYTDNIRRDDAVTYLEALDAGSSARHYEVLREAKKEQA